MTTHVFDEAIALEPLRENTFRGHTSPRYANFIGPFGGVTAAQAINAVLKHPQRLGDPVAFTVNFAAPLADGEFDVIARPVRTNRSTQHWTIAIEQDGQTVVTATAFTAVRRETWGTTEAKMPEVARPGDLEPPAHQGRVEWTRRYDLRFISGGYPEQWDGGDTGGSLTRQWVRDNPPRPLDFASLTAMSDIFFPRMWLRRKTFVPLGTVSMTVYFHAIEQQLRDTGDSFLMGQSQGQGFGSGYFDHTAQLWNEAGLLLATTQQVVYYKE